MIQTRKSLLLRIRNHQDRDSWEEFSRLYRPIITRYAESQGIPRDDAADIAQEVFLQLMRLDECFVDRNRAGSFRAWLKTVTRHKVMDWFRRKKPAFGVELQALQEPADNSAGEADFLETEEKRQIILTAMNHVRETIGSKTWKCFEEHILKRRKAGEVAQELKTSENAVYVNCSRVVGKIRERCQSCREELVYAS